MSFLKRYIKFWQFSRDSRLSVSDKSKYKRQIDTRDRVGIYVVLDTQSNVSGDLNITCFCYQKLYTRNPCFSCLSVADTQANVSGDLHIICFCYQKLYTRNACVSCLSVADTFVCHWHSSECLWRLAYYVFVIKNYIQETPVSRIYEKPLS